MTRLYNPAEQFFDGSGQVVANGFLYFYEPGTSTLKDTFEDAALTTPNANPYQLDGYGRVDNVFMSGEYRVVLTTANGRVLWDRDPVGEIITSGDWQAWDNTNTYDANDIVVGSDGLYYSSIVGSNLNNNPTVQPSAFWTEILFIRPWLAANTYRQGELTIASDGRTYQSQAGANTGNNPISDTTNWKLVVQAQDAPEFTGATFDKTNAQQLDINFDNDNLTRWAWSFKADESINIDRYDGVGSYLNTPLSIDTAGAMTITSSLTVVGSTTVNGPAAADSITVDTTGSATDAEIVLDADTNQAESIIVKSNGFTEWVVKGEAATNDFEIERWSGGALVDTPFNILNATGTINMPNIVQIGSDLELQSSEATILATNVSATAINFDLDNTTGNLSINAFKTTNSTGNRNIKFYKGDGTSTVTVNVDAADGSILTAADEGGKKIRKVTLDSAAPSGGSDGDIWLRPV